MRGGANSNLFALFVLFLVLCFVVFGEDLLELRLLVKDHVRRHVGKLVSNKSSNAAALTSSPKVVSETTKAPFTPRPFHINTKGEHMAGLRSKASLREQYTNHAAAAEVSAAPPRAPSPSPTPLSPPVDVGAKSPGAPTPSPTPTAACAREAAGEGRILNNAHSPRAGRLHVATIVSPRYTTFAGKLVSELLLNINSEYEFTMERVPDPPPAPSNCTYGNKLCGWSGRVAFLADLLRQKVGDASSANDILLFFDTTTWVKEPIVGLGLNAVDPWL